MCFLNDTLEELNAHIRRHLRKLEDIIFPFGNCGCKFKVKSRFSSHLTRKHSNCTITDLSETNMQDQTPSDTSTPEPVAHHRSSHQLPRHGHQLPRCCHQLLRSHPRVPRHHDLYLLQVYHHESRQEGPQLANEN